MSPLVRPTPDPTPNSVPTAIVLPSGLTSIVVGYHPVGMSPRNRGTPPDNVYIATAFKPPNVTRSEEHTSELQSRRDLVCRLLLEKKKNNTPPAPSHS